MGFGPFFVCGARDDASMAALEAVMEPAVAGLGYELVDVQASNGGRLLPCSSTSRAASTSRIAPP